MADPIPGEAAETAETAGGAGNPPAKLLPWPVRWLLLVFAGLCLAAGAIGIFVPGLPTTVFVLLAAWAAGRSSPRLDHWLTHHRIFGPMITDWRRGGVVSRRVKWRASAAMALCALIVALTSHRAWTAGMAIGSMACVLLWLWRRPESAAPSGVGPD